MMEKQLDNNTNIYTYYKALFAFTPRHSLYIGNAVDSEDKDQPANLVLFDLHNPLVYFAGQNTL